MIAAFFADNAGPICFLVCTAQPSGRPINRGLTPGCIQRRIKRADQRQSLNNRGIIFARHIAHQRAHPPRMINEQFQIRARAGSAAGFERSRCQTPFDQIIVKGCIILQIHF